MDTVSLRQQNLRKGIATVASASARNATLPVLEHILIRSEEGGQIRLAATDLERMISCTVQGRAGDLDVTVPTKVLQEFVNALPDEVISMTPGSRLLVECGGSRSNLSILPGHEFPTFPEMHGTTADIAPHLLKAAIDSVAPMAANDESRPVLTACLVEIREDLLTISAADGFRLATRTLRLSEPVKEPISLLVPASTLLDLGRLLAEEDKPVTIGAGPLVFFLLHGDCGKNAGAVSSIVLASTVIEGNYPKVESLIPTEATITTTVKVERSVLLNALATVNVFARKTDHHITLTIGPEEIGIVSEAEEVGRGEIGVPAQVTGGEIQISVNATFFGQAVRAIEDHEIALDLGKDTAPITVRPASQTRQDVDRHIHVIMPMMTRK